MTFQDRFCKLILCAMLAVNAMLGAPLRPKDVEALMHEKDRPKITQAISGGEGSEDDADTAG